MDATEMVIVNMSIVHIDIAYARQPALVASMLGGDKSCWWAKWSSVASVMFCSSAVEECGGGGVEIPNGENVDVLAPLDDIPYPGWVGRFDLGKADDTLERIDEVAPKAEEEGVGEKNRGGGCVTM
jgi:hypothetical protein